MAICKNCGKKGLLLKVNSNGVCSDCEITNLHEEIASLQKRLCPEEQDIIRLKKEIDNLSQISQSIELKIGNLESQKLIAKDELAALQEEIEEKEDIIIELDEEILMQDFGLYQPKFDFCNSEKYKLQINKIRNLQKEIIKNGGAVTGNTSWSINGSVSEGRKAIKDMQKLLLRAFNSECDEIVNKVKYNNFEPSLKRITASCDAISKLGKMMDISISQYYYELKVDELQLALEYQMQKQKEKEEQKMFREQQREEAKIQKEIEEARKKAQKEQTHYLNALNKLNSQIEKTQDDTQKNELLAKKQEIESQLGIIEKSLEDIDYRQANQRAGYVYIISNIGSFGENVYKIGMTRRLDPTERVDELGDASVPFKFDIHAMIFSDDAPGLENALHKAFEDRKLNMVNPRREFFRVTLDEIKSVVNEHYDKTAEFIDIADAEQFRLSEKMREK